MRSLFRETKGRCRRRNSTPAAPPANEGLQRDEVRAFGDDGLGGELALLELGLLGFILRLRPVVPNMIAVSLRLSCA
jgi:hypothetical protein